MDQPLLVGRQRQGAEVLLEEVPGLVQIERQFNGIDLGHMPLHAQPPQAQRRCCPRGDRNVQVGRAMVEKFLHQAMRRR
ncbi:hypothetical protein D3C84_816290 [compost metagenome]